MDDSAISTLGMGMGMFTAILLILTLIDHMILRNKDGDGACHGPPRGWDVDYCCWCRSVPFGG